MDVYYLTSLGDKSPTLDEGLEVQPGRQRQETHPPLPPKGLYEGGRYMEVPHISQFLLSEHPINTGKPKGRGIFFF